MMKMMCDRECKIVFCDVDGTLLSSKLEVLPGTLKAIHSLQKRGIPFIIASSRGPMAIRPIFSEWGFSCPTICYGGALLLDTQGGRIASSALAHNDAARVLAFVEGESLECTWNIYAGDMWLVKDRIDPRVVLEEHIVRAASTQGSLASIGKGEVHKILLMCEPSAILDIECKLKDAFPALSVVKSSSYLLEVMQGGVTKAGALCHFCALYGVSTDETAAFGDNYNDEQMLKVVGLPFLMGNAPEELKSRFKNVAPDNDSEGIYLSLKKLRLVD